jgi:hypothetical protein
MSSNSKCHPARVSVSFYCTAIFDIRRDGPALSQARQSPCRGRPPTEAQNPADHRGNRAVARSVPVQRRLRQKTAPARFGGSGKLRPPVRQGMRTPCRAIAATACASGRFRPRIRIPRTQAERLYYFGGSEGGPWGGSAVSDRPWS